MALNFGGRGLFPDEFVKDGNTGAILSSSDAEDASRNKLQIIKFAAVTNGTVTVYTVPVGKIVYITGYSLSAGNKDQAAWTAVQLYIDPVVGANYYLAALSIPERVTEQSAGQTLSNDLRMPYKLVAGDAIKLLSDMALVSTNCVIFGWEEDA